MTSIGKFVSGKVPVLGTERIVEGYDVKPMAKGASGEVILYEAPDGEVRLDVRLDLETVWLSLSQMTELFGRDKSVISRHLNSVFSSGELEREAVVAKNATTAADGKTY